MKICVIGGTGNISRSIVVQLINQGHDVYCFNRGLSGKVPDGAHQITGDRNNKKLEPILEEKWYSSYYGVKKKSTRLSFESNTNMFTTKITYKK